MIGLRYQWIVEYLRRIPFAVIGVSAYLVGFVILLEFDQSIILLSVFALASIIFADERATTFNSSMLLLLAFFVASTAISCVVSVNYRHSLALSSSILPACLIFFMISFGFSSASHLRYLCFSLTALTMIVSGAVIYTAVQESKTSHEWVADLGSAVILVPNDIMLLSIVAPFLLALFGCERHVIVRILIGASLLSSLIAISILQSRGALLTLLISSGTFIALFRPKLVVVSGMGVLLGSFVVDGFFGFPLLAKVAKFSYGGIPLWLAAWAMFLDAPLLGNGSHTYGLLVPLYIKEANLAVWPSLSSVAPLWPTNEFSPWAHNLYLEMLAEQGIVGLAALLMVLYRTTRLSWQLRTVQEGNIRIYGIAALAALASFCFASILELTFIRLWVTIFFFLVVGVIDWLVQQAQQKEGVSNV